MLGELLTHQIKNLNTAQNIRGFDLTPCVLGLIPYSKVINRHIPILLRELEICEVPVDPQVQKVTQLKELLKSNEHKEHDATGKYFKPKIDYDEWAI